MENPVEKEGETQIAGEKKAEEKSKNDYEYLDSILLNLPLGIAILEGPDFRYFKINKVLANMNGLSVEDHLGKTVAEVLPEAIEHIIPNLRKVLESGEPILGREFSVRLPKNLEKILHLMDFHFPIKIDGKIKAVGAIVMDITDRKNAEEELQKRNEELEKFNKIAIDRELRMIELKKEINELYEKSGEQSKYKIVEEKE